MRTWHFSGRTEERQGRCGRAPLRTPSQGRPPRHPAEPRAQGGVPGARGSLELGEQAGQPQLTHFFTGVAAARFPEDALKGAGERESGLGAGRGLWVGAASEAVGCLRGGVWGGRGLPGEAVGTASETVGAPAANLGSAVGHRAAGHTWQLDTLAQGVALPTSTWSPVLTSQRYSVQLSTRLLTQVSLGCNTVGGGGVSKRRAEGKGRRAEGLRANPLLPGPAGRPPWDRPSAHTPHSTVRPPSGTRSPEGGVGSVIPAALPPSPPIHTLGAQRPPWQPPTPAKPCPCPGLGVPRRAYLGAGSVTGVLLTLHNRALGVPRQASARVAGSERWEGCPDLQWTGTVEVTLRQWGGPRARSPPCGWVG